MRASPADDGCTRDAPWLRRRGLWALACAAAGIIIAREFPHVWPGAWVGAAAAFTTLAIVLHSRRCVVALALAMATLSGAWMHARVYTTEADALTARLHVRGDTPTVLRVRGVVRERPRTDPRPSTLDLWLNRSARPRTPATFSVRLIDAGPVNGEPLSPVSGVLWVSAFPASAAEGVHAGDTVALTGLFRAPAPPLLVGRRDARVFAAQEGVAGWLIVHDSPIDTVDAPGAWTDRLDAAWYRVQAHLRAMAVRALDAPPATDTGADGPADTDSDTDTGTVQARALLRALLLGQYDPSIRPVADAWGRLGLLHALSISGFHIAVMAGMALVLVRLPGDLGRWEALIACALVGLYLIIIPAQAPVLRSGLMIGVVLLAESLGRRYDRVNLLAWIAVALLAWRPADLFDPGFQLSFALTAAVMTLGRPTAHWLLGPRGVRGRRIKPVGVLGALARWARAAVASLIGSSVLAWCVATPILAYHFGVFSPLAIIASVLVVPVIVPTLWLGYLAIVIGVLVPPAGAWCGVALDALGRVLVSMTAWMDELPGAGVMLPDVPLWLAAAGVGAALWVFVVRDRRDARVWTAVGAAALAASVTLTIAWRSPRAPTVTPLLLDEGSCTLVQDGGVGVLVDVGTERAGELARLARDLPAAVRALGGWRTPTVILTSARPGACSGLLDVIRPLGIERVIVSPGLHAVWTGQRGTPLAVLLSLAAAQGVTIEVAHDGDQLRLPHGRLALDPQSDGTMRVSLVRYGDGGAPPGTSVIPSSALPMK